MSFNFFSNNVVYVDGENIERVTSLKNTRGGGQTIFDVPSHNMDTDNLIIFCDRVLQIRDVDYIDYNSNQIQFNRVISKEIDVDAILIRGNRELEWGYF